MILETIVATRDAAGAPNFAPMGIRLAGESVVLRPFRTARTCANLEAGGDAVVNFTDDALVFARCALLSDLPPHHAATRVAADVLDDACHWKEVVVRARTVEGERATFEARVVAEGRGRDALLFNRARHAVVEATILATRLEFLERAQVVRDLDRLRPLVEKTGGPREREAFALVERIVRDRGAA